MLALLFVGAALVPVALVAWVTLWAFGDITMPDRRPAYIRVEASAADLYRVRREV